MMNEVIFLKGLQNIFAAHGKKVPDEAVRNSIFKRINKFPDAFMDYAVTRLENSVELPHNLGLFFVRELWPDFLEDNPHLRSVHDRIACPKCIPGMPGWRYVYRPFPDWECRIVRCTCGNIDNSRLSDIPIYSDSQLIEMGYQLTMPDPCYCSPRYGKWLNRFLGEKEQHCPESILSLNQEEF